MTTICSSCMEICQIRTEPDTFDAHGPRGTILGNLGDVEVSDCCGEPIEEVDSDLFEYWEELKKLAEVNDIEWFVSDYPERHRESFEDGVPPEEVIKRYKGCRHA